MPGAPVYVLALALLALPPPQERLTLEIRSYRATEEVSDATRVIVHRAGEREQPVGVISRTRRTLDVAPGIYDAQAVLERNGRVLDIRWVERLVVMLYPDEAGHHLEVINFINGFGALQVRPGGGRSPGTEMDIALFTADEHSQPAAVPVVSSVSTVRVPYALFVVRAGRYDVLISRASTQTWHTAIDVPRDRTRLWIVP